MNRFITSAASTDHSLRRRRSFVHYWVQIFAAVAHLHERWTIVAYAHFSALVG